MKPLMTFACCILFCGIITAQDGGISEKIDAHREAVLVVEEMMRDPFIVVGPDSLYYLTYTIIDGDRQGAGLYTSPDLKEWTKHPDPYSLRNSSFYKTFARKAEEKGDILKLWAPEFHWIEGKWRVVHTSNVQTASMAYTSEESPGPPWTDWGEGVMGHRHDPSLFSGEDGSRWLVARCAIVQRLNEDLSGYAGEEIPIGPSDRKLGHEGCQILKIGDKYVLFGTAWSTDRMRKGTYNLYYCTADQLTGPYGPRRFAGRCLGHGTVFRDLQGRWWCTAFKNGTYVAPGDVYRHGADPEVATTMNREGCTLVPMDIEIINGDVRVRARDTHYARPGSEEVQDFSGPDS